jgi:peptide/nickel transport system permease protein
MKRNQLRQYLKKPGSYRIIAGTVIVVLLALATITGSVWTHYGADEMDLESQLTPPTIGWLKKILATEEGLRIQKQNRAGGRAGLRPPPPTIDDEDLDFLQSGSSDPKNDSNSEKKQEAGVAEISEDSSEADPVGILGDLPSNSGNETELASVPGEVNPVLDKYPHYLGTDRNGRDIFALLIAGARNCFLPGLVTCAVALGLGVPLGLWAGYYGGSIRKIVQTFNSTILSLPRLVLILVVICALEPNVYYTMGVLGATLVPRVSELISTRVRILSNMGFILAAKEAALSDTKILWRHLFWYQNRAVFFIQFSLIMAESILVETTLSYLQFGTKPPEVSWGNIIEGSQMSFFSGFYWITFFPAMAIILAILGFFYLGDGLNARLAYREGR